MYVYIYIYIYTYVCTCVYIHIYIYTYIDIYLYTIYSPLHRYYYLYEEFTRLAETRLAQNTLTYLKAA